MGCSFSHSPAEPISTGGPPSQHTKPAPAPVAEAPAAADAQDGATYEATTLDDGAADAIVPEAPADQEPPPKGSGAEAEMGTQDELSANLEIVIAIFKGICKGFIHETLPGLEPVIKNAEKVFKDFTAAVTNFELGDTQSMIGALTFLGVALEEMRSAMSEAGAAQEQVEELAKAVLMFADPKNLVDQLGSEILVNGKNILGLIQEAVKAFRHSDWELFGEQIGLMVGEVLTPETPMTPSLFDTLFGCCTCCDQPEFR